MRVMRLVTTIQVHYVFQCSWKELVTKIKNIVCLIKFGSFADCIQYLHTSMFYEMHIMYNYMSGSVKGVIYYRALKDKEETNFIWKLCLV